MRLWRRQVRNRQVVGSSCRLRGAPTGTGAGGADSGPSQSGGGHVPGTLLSGGKTVPPTSGRKAGSVVSANARSHFGSPQGHRRSTDTALTGGGAGGTTGSPSQRHAECDDPDPWLSVGLHHSSNLNRLAVGTVVVDCRTPTRVESARRRTRVAPWSNSGKGVGTPSPRLVNVLPAGTAASSPTARAQGVSPLSTGVVESR